MFRSNYYNNINLSTISPPYYFRSLECTQKIIILKFNKYVKRLANRIETYRSGSVAATVVRPAKLQSTSYRQVVIYAISVVI